VRWAGARREITIDLENETDQPLMIEQPEPRRVRVTVFLDEWADDRACGVEPDRSKHPGKSVELAAGEAVLVRVDLGRACAGLPPGEYRFEISYEPPPVASGPSLRPRPRNGRVIVEAGTARPDPHAFGPGPAPPSPR
jgi:hypothetical protein